MVPSPRLSTPSSPSSTTMPPPTINHPAPQKKPRHRHSPAQLAALNELFEKSEHPSLELRSSLADRLGMETKTVNAWFQNKRASSKKRTRGVPHDSPPANPLPTPQLSSAPSSRHSELEDFPEDDYQPLDYPRSAPSLHPDMVSPFYAANTENPNFLAENETIPRRMRMRPSIEQTEELRQLYNINPHPSTEQRQALSERIGMRYQSITNWFQNQRSLAKKRKEDEVDAAALLSSNTPGRSHENRQYSGFPPPSHHPSLVMHSTSGHPSIAHPSRIRRSPSISPSMDDPPPRRSSSRQSSTPYGSSSSFSRPRRSRPEPYQLDALKELYMKTPTPTIEERSALAMEIGMDVGKVTNWFRNLRQTARKRAKRTGSADYDDYDGFNGTSFSASVSRSGTPSLRSSSSSMNEDMNVEDYDMHSDVGSEDEYQEAVTPEPSPSPPPSGSRSRIAVRNTNVTANTAHYAELEKVSTTQFSGVKIEDALLLLSFHQHIVH